MARKLDRDELKKNRGIQMGTNVQRHNRPTGMMSPSNHNMSSGSLDGMLGGGSPHRMPTTPQVKTSLGHDTRLCFSFLSVRFHIVTRTIFAEISLYVTNSWICLFAGHIAARQLIRDFLARQPVQHGWWLAGVTLHAIQCQRHSVAGIHAQPGL